MERRPIFASWSGKEPCIEVQKDEQLLVRIESIDILSDINFATSVTAEQQIRIFGFYGMPKSPSMSTRERHLPTRTPSDVILAGCGESCRLILVMRILDTEIMVLIVKILLYVP